MLNRTILIGRLTADPELRYTPSGVPVANMRIAVDRPFASQSGEKQTDFIRVIAWRQNAEFAANYLAKGRLIAVDGRLQIRQWTTQDGQRRETAEVVSDRLQGLDRPRETGAQPPGDEESVQPDTDAGEGAEIPDPWQDQ